MEKIQVIEKWLGQNGQITSLARQNCSKIVLEAENYVFAHIEAQEVD